MSSKKILLALSITAFTQLHAQQRDTTTIHQLDEVVITANKILQKQSTTGKVITVIAKETIEKSIGKTLPQLLNEQAGITINGALNNSGANQTLYVRGASAGRTLVLIDGIPAYDPSFITSEFDLNLLSLNNIETIEISRGAQSTLYGSDAVAGVINIITTKKNITKAVNIKAAFSAGSFNTFRENIQFYGKAEKLSYNAGFAHISNRGFSSAYDSTGNKNFDDDGYKNSGANLSLQYQIFNDLSLRTFIKYNRYKTELDDRLFVDEKDYSATNKMLMTGLNFEYRKNNVSLTGNYQYTQSNRDYLNDSTYVDPSAFGNFSTDKYRSRTQFVELFSSINLSKNFTFLQGADHRFSQMHSKYFSVSSYGNYEPDAFDSSHSQSSLYASLMFHDNKEKLNIELGGRLNVHSRYGTNSTYTFNPSYNIDQHFRIFGSIASGYKAPTLYQLFSAYGNKDLQPELSKTYEAGIQQKHTFISNRIVYFHREINKGIDFDNFNYLYVNINKQVVNGLEIETKIAGPKGLNLSANYTYLNPSENTQSRITFKDSSYNYLLRRPKHNLNATVSFQFENGVFISTSGKYVSSRYDAGGYQAADILLKSYFILSAYTDYKFKDHLKFFVDAQNITNKKFFDVRGYNSIPFLINGGVIFNW